MNPTPGRRHPLEELYYAALDLPPDEGAAYLKKACADEQLRSEVESLPGSAIKKDVLFEHSPWPQPAAVECGTMMGPYRIGDPIGAGGMGEVYRARDTRLRHDIAVKILPANITGDPARRARFMREAQSASRLDHRNIVTIYDIGESDGRVYIAMEYVTGRTLDAVIRSGALPFAEVVNHTIPIAAALAKAHAAGMIHRDLKPGNILMTPEGMVKLLDFGLAKMIEEPTAPKAASADGIGEGHTRVHVAGAGRRSDRGRPKRYLLLRVGALRDDRGEASLSRQFDAGDNGRGVAQRSGAAPGGSAARTGDNHRAVSLPGSGVPVPEHGGCAGRAPGNAGRAPRRGTWNSGGQPAAHSSSGAPHADTTGGRGALYRGSGDTFNLAWTPDRQIVATVPAMRSSVTRA